MFELIFSFMFGAALGFIFTTLYRISEEKTRILTDLRNTLENLRKDSMDYWANPPTHHIDAIKQAEINYIFRQLPEKFEDAARVYGKVRFELDVSNLILEANRIVTGNDYASANRGYGLDRAEEAANAFLRVISNLDAEVVRIRRFHPFSKINL